ncbi:MAG TPA: molybdate ABC transporter substrate-binding protein [Candidatus Lumbricidophila sp.]|nr:molybdate ABC transporter substrate-binding protein [Candidatus Lumbricidophila sp.]
MDASRRTTSLMAALLASTLSVLALTGCGQRTEIAATDAPITASTLPAAVTVPQLSGTLKIFAAASLATVLADLAREFEAEHPALTVAPIVADGSSTLATQLIGGAQADVFLSADEATMKKVTDASFATTPVKVATNTLQIAVAPGNPRGITSLASLADGTRGDLLVVLCQAQVPCGSASHKLLAALGITLTPASEEENVSAVLAKVKSGEADAGLVYATDVAAAGGAVTGVPIPGADAARTTAVGVALSHAANADAAAAFLVFLTGAKAQQVLASAGFGAP